MLTYTGMGASDFDGSEGCYGCGMEKMGEKRLLPSHFFRIGMADSISIWLFRQIVWLLRFRKEHVRKVHPLRQGCSAAG